MSQPPSLPKPEQFNESEMVLVLSASSLIKTIVLFLAIGSCNYFIEGKIEHLSFVFKIKTRVRNYLMDDMKETS